MKFFYRHGAVYSEREYVSIRYNEQLSLLKPHDKTHSKEYTHAQLCLFELIWLEIMTISEQVRICATLLHE